MTERAKRSSPASASTEPGQPWEVDLFRPQDAEGVSHLFRTVYGGDYPVRTFLDPQRLIAENTAGKTISTVARTPRGDIVGHVALFCSTPYELLYESGAGLVLPDYRGGAIMSALFAHQELDAEKFGVEIIFGEPVCNHVFMQKLCVSQGWVTCGLELDLMPAEAYTAERSASGRVSVLVDFKFRKPRFQKIYLPDAYGEILHFIYQDVGEDRDFAFSSSSVGLPPGISTRIEPQVFEFAKVARLAIHEAGQDLDAALEVAEKAAGEKAVVVFQVWGKLSWPWTGRVVERLRSRGYFMGGALPRWFDDDGFLMQKTLARPNWDGIQLYSDRAKRLLDLVRTDWERTQRG